MIVDTKPYVLTWVAGRRHLGSSQEACAVARELERGFRALGYRGDPRIAVHYRDGTPIDWKEGGAS